MIPKKRHAKRFLQQQNRVIRERYHKAHKKDLSLISRCKGLKLIYPVLAVHYRLPPSIVQGSWKQFDTPTKANIWLKIRCSKTETSGKGAALYATLDAVMSDYRDSDHLALVLALEHYLKWRLQ